MSQTAVETNGSLEPVISGVERSSSDKWKIWFFQNRFNVVGAVAAVSQLSAIYLVEYTPVTLDFSDDVYEEVAFVNNLQVQQQTVSAPEVIAEGEIKPTEKLEKPKKDDRVASAVNPMQVNATMPVDLNPSLKPDYTADARKAGIEGTLILSIVIADSGEVLEVRPMYRNAEDRAKFESHGLSAEAIRVYRRKRFSPAKKEGEPITVRVNIPIRFYLK